MSHPFKFTAPTDKMPGSWHGAYLPIYEWLFGEIKDSHDTIAEVGCDGGGSILMYAYYFHQAWKVISCDISPRPASLDADKRIHHFQGDAYSSGIQAEMAKLAPYAWICDDGPHTLSSQETFCRDFPKLLSAQGIACVEDVQDICHFKTLAAVLSPEFFGFGIDLRMHDGRYDNLLFVIKRR